MDLRGHLYRLQTVVEQCPQQAVKVFKCGLHPCQQSRRASFEPLEVVMPWITLVARDFRLLTVPTVCSEKEHLFYTRI